MKEKTASSDLPLSELCQTSHRDIARCLGVLAASIAIVVASGVVDPLGCVACGYAVCLLLLQNAYVEWPEYTFKLYFVFASAFACLLVPCSLEAVGVWEFCIVRLFCAAFDCAVIFATWWVMIRGPSLENLSPGSLSGKTMLVTGCNTGIGFETVSVLAGAGATVIVACRSEFKARTAMRKLIDESGGRVSEDQLRFLPLDLSSFESVRKCAKMVEDTGLNLDVLVLNAGVMLSSRKLSAEGIEMTLASNHFGHFLLVMLLLPGLLQAEEKGKIPRIVCVGSNLCYKYGRLDLTELTMCTQIAEKKLFLRRPYTMFRAYALSKMLNIYMTTELSRRLLEKKSQIPVNCLHPGSVQSDVMRDMHPILTYLYGIFKPLCLSFMKTTRCGSWSTVHLATSPKTATASDATGQFWVRMQPAPLSNACADSTNAANVWDLSVEFTGAPRVV